MNHALTEVLLEIAAETAPYPGDLLEIGKRAALETQRFKQGEIDFDRVAFWHKSLVRTFFASVDGICASVRRVLAEHHASFGIPLRAGELRALRVTGPRMNVYRGTRLALETFARFFKLDLQVDPNGADWKGFARLSAARARLTHPYRWQDVYPFSLFPSTHPGIEWFVHTWRSLLGSASHSLGLPIQEPPVPPRLHFFSEIRLDEFEREQEGIEGGQVSNSWIKELSQVVFPLFRETSWSLDLVSEALRPNASISAPTAIRLFARNLFSNIEGAVLAADRAQGRQQDPNYLPDKSLITGGSEEVRNRIITALESFSCDFGTSHHINREGAGYSAFVEARRLRNAYTHPPGPHQFAAGVEQLEVLMAVFGWWNQELDRSLTLRIS